MKAKYLFLFLFFCNNLFSQIDTVHSQVSFKDNSKTKIAVANYIMSSFQRNNSNDKSYFYYLDATFMAPTLIIYDEKYSLWGGFKICNRNYNAKNS